jgi:hypothetical protein
MRTRNSRVIRTLGRVAGPWAQRLGASDNGANALECAPRFIFQMGVFNFSTFGAAAGVKS